MNFDIGAVLSRAWQIVWKYKILWLFGLLYSCGQTGGGNGGGGGRSSGGSSNSLFGSPTFPQNWLHQTISGQETMMIIGAIIAGILLILAVIGLNAMGKIGLVRGTIRAEEGAERLSFGELWQTRYFGRLVGLNLLVGLAVLLLLSLFIAPIVVSGIWAGGSPQNAPLLAAVLLCLVPLLCVFVPALLVLSIWIELAQNALVVENLGIVASLRRGWAVFRQNLVNVLIMGFILWLISLTATLLVSLPIILVILPAVLGVVAGSIAEVNGLIYTGIGLALLCLCLYMPFGLAGTSILFAYKGSAWALTYMRLAGQAAPKEQWAAGGLENEPLPPAI